MKIQLMPHNQRAFFSMNKRKKIKIFSLHEIFWIISFAQELWNEICVDKKCDLFWWQRFIDLLAHLQGILDVKMPTCFDPTSKCSVLIKLTCSIKHYCVLCLCNSLRFLKIADLSISFPTPQFCDSFSPFYSLWTVYENWTLNLCFLLIFSLLFLSI